MNALKHLDKIAIFLALNYLLLLVLTGCNNRRNKKFQILDCYSQYVEVSQDSVETKWNKTNAQIIVANCLFEKYFERKDSEYKNELVKLAKIINANIEIYHDTIKESNFEYIEEANNRWKPKNPYEFHIQALE